MKSITTTIIACVMTLGPSFAQSNDSQISNDSLNKRVDAIAKEMSALKRIKISGYIQAQYQWADSAGINSFAGGNFANGQDNRFMIRRGRLKVAYTSNPNKKGINTSMYVLQIDATQKGFALKEVYAKITDPWIGWVSASIGMLEDPFGYEVTVSSSSIESPERGRMSQIHFPNEYEVGAMLTVQGPKDSDWKWLTWKAGFFNGNGAPSSGIDVSDWDSKKDFITRLSADKQIGDKKINAGGGISYYDGGFRIDSVAVYKSGTDANGVQGFIIQSTATENGSVAIASRGNTKRQYYGVDAHVSFDWAAGTTTLRGEYIAGEQPGSSSNTRSPNSFVPNLSDVYARNFNGAYFYFIQSIMKSPFRVVVKYDWYDPNTDVKGDDIGKAVSGSAKATGAADVRYDTWGTGLIYNFDKNVKITAYYDFVTNETSSNLSGFTKDISDNVFTLRAQVKF